MTTAKLRFALVLFVFTIAASTARAQIGAYLNFTAQHIDSSARNIGDTAGDLSDGTWVFGPQLGFYNDFMHLGPLHLGTDFRGSILSHGDAKFNNGMGGLRASIHSFALPISPYVQASAGIAGFNYGRPQGMTKILQYELSGGVDLTVFPRIDWKLVEIGGGALTTFGKGEDGANGTFHISTGLAVRF
ncbi:MAG: hypothetical protein JSS87_14825 [Acidobacteria bacterium]|nr:hypothetical protein [Acidobacteriota bacterium]